MTDDANLMPDDMEIGNPAEAIDMVGDTLEMFLATADVERVYGTPIQQGETLIIPAAEVLAGLGFGAGYGFGRGNEQDSNAGTGGGGGGGGGGRTFSRPVAVVIASPDGVRVEPVVDPTKIALALFTTVGFMFAFLGKLIKRPGRVARKMVVS